MNEYPKIETLFDRDLKTFKVIEGKWRLPEFEYLRNNIWLFTEKIDGTNIRVMWNGHNLTFGGKTDNAQIPAFLLTKLQEQFTVEKFRGIWLEEPMEVCLYGEGFGARIQKGGGNYNPKGVEFALFDVKIGEWWLEQDNIIDIADKMGISLVPKVGEGTLSDAVKLVKDGYKSSFGDFLAEGIVVRPIVSLFTRSNHRIIGKIKFKDF